MPEIMLVPLQPDTELEVECRKCGGKVVCSMRPRNGAAMPPGDGCPLCNSTDWGVCKSAINKARELFALVDGAGLNVSFRTTTQDISGVPPKGEA